MNTDMWRNAWYIPCLLAMAIFFVSCGDRKPAGVSDPSPDNAGQATSAAQHAGKTAPYTLRIVPQDAYKGKTLTLAADGFSLDGIQVLWTVNGVYAVSESAGRFKVVEARKGNVIQARALFEGSEIISNTVVVRNSLPEVSKVRILPEGFEAGDALTIEASAQDNDEDEVILTYSWTKNGKPAGEGPQLKEPIRRGDKISVRIVPFDGEAYGTSAIISREIMNLPPVIGEHRGFDITAGRFMYQVEATDPDGDQLTYALKKAPEGMSISPDKGRITWDIPRSFRGKTDITLSVTDGNGGEATYQLVADIGGERRP
jgi:hypothetical protein